MNEVHAYQNFDGTYRVEILGTECTTKYVGKHKIEETTKSKVEIPSAFIDIAVCKSSHPNLPALTIKFDEEDEYV